jgi:cyanate permease
VTRPNLGNRNELEAYRAELRRLHRPWRILALALVIAGLIGAMLDPAHELWWYALMIIGAIGVFAVIVARTRYHQRRMRGA